MYHLIPPVHQVEPNNRIHVGRVIMLVSRCLTCRSTVITFCVERSLHFALTFLLHFASMLLHFALVLSSIVGVGQMPFRGGDCDGVRWGSLCEAVFV